LSGTQKTLTKLKVQANKLYEQKNTGLQVARTVKANAAKPELLRELFKVQVHVKNHVFKFNRPMLGTVE